MTPSPALDLVSLARHLHSLQTLAETFDSVASSARRLFGADAAFVLRSQPGGLALAGCHGDRAEAAAHAELHAGAGPSWECLAGRDLFVGRATDPQAHPQWTSGTAELGFEDALSVRLWTPRSTIGALTVLRQRGPDPLEGFAQAQSDLAVEFAAHASIAIATAQTESELRCAIEGRHSIGLAQGILMERFGLPKEKAFDVLRRYSQDGNTKLRAVAQQIVATGELPAERAVSGRRRTAKPRTDAAAGSSDGTELNDWNLSPEISPADTPA